jgi:NAD(P)-dependent dehydrogenase (short-subunit alcohol dehydrogenase family)
MTIDALHRGTIQSLGQQGAIVDLIGQVVLITGGSRGLGRALLAAGARVAITGRSAAELHETAAQLSSAANQVLCFDFTKES